MFTKSRKVDSLISTERGDHKQLTYSSLPVCDNATESHRGIEAYILVCKYLHLHLQLRDRSRNFIDEDHLGLCPGCTLKNSRD